jgi:hypothetical protein
MLQVGETGINQPTTKKKKKKKNAFIHLYKTQKLYLFLNVILAGLKKLSTSV